MENREPQGPGTAQWISRKGGFCGRSNKQRGVRPGSPSTSPDARYRPSGNLHDLTTIVPSHASLALLKQRGSIFFALHYQESDGHKWERWSDRSWSRSWNAQIVSFWPEKRLCAVELFSEKTTNLKHKHTEMEHMLLCIDLQKVLCASMIMGRVEVWISQHAFPCVTIPGSESLLR
jgi:hypothetical protein